MAKSTKPSVPSAAPGTEDSAAVKPRRTFYPGLKVDDKKNPTVKIEKIPDDFNPKDHLPLRRRDFVDEATWFEMKADEFAAKATSFRTQASNYRKLGSLKDRARAKKLVAMQARMDELKTQLAAQGINVDELLSSTSDEKKEK
jgi:hypothetical protein